MKTNRQALGYAVVLAGLALLGACGGQLKSDAPPATAPGEAAPTSPPAQTAAAEAEAEPVTLAEAEALLERARADLDRLALNAPGASSGAAGVPSPAPPPAAAHSRDDAPRAEKSASAADAAAPPAKEVSTCETACKAFSSLARASDAVCRLDSDGGKRCERARQIRNDASQRVASCGCSR